MKPLSERELACLNWAAAGKTSWEVGVILGVSERTVNFHIHNACGKLGVHSRQAAITVGLQTGLLSDQLSLDRIPQAASQPHPVPRKARLPDREENSLRRH